MVADHTHDEHELLEALQDVAILAPYGSLAAHKANAAIEAYLARRATTSTQQGDEPPLPDFFKWWVRIETDQRKSMLVWARKDQENLHSLLRQVFEAGVAEMGERGAACRVGGAQPVPKTPETRMDASSDGGAACRASTQGCGKCPRSTPYGQGICAACVQGDENARDAVRLDWLEGMANRPQGLLLHDGGDFTGRLGLGLRRIGRSLRDAVDAAMGKEIDAARAAPGAAEQEKQQ